MLDLQNALTEHIKTGKLCEAVKNHGILCTILYSRFKGTNLAPYA
jgi:hypothetical protein